MSTSVPFLNVVDPEFDFCAPEVLAAQAASWYAESPIGLVVLRYVPARALLRDPRFDHNGRLFMERNGVVDGPVHDWFVPMIVNRDGADHRRLRGLVNRAFTPRVVENLRPFIRARAEELADRLAENEISDFVTDFGDPMPLAVMCELLGVPPEDHDVFRGWSTDIGLVFSVAHGGEIPGRVAAALLGLSGYVESLMAAKARKPGEDLISALIAARREDGGLVSREELLNLVITLVFAAHDTTRHQLANAMVAFAEHPGQWSVLGQRPELAERAVEEVMRWRPSTTIAYRYAVDHLEFEGLPLAPGDCLTVCVATTQRDPAVFHGGDRFDITVPREAPPLQFGAGPHHCLGAALARAEVGEVLPLLARRFGPPRIAGPVSWSPPMGIHGPETLPLSFASDANALR